MMSVYCGIDFGTSNSVVTVIPDRVAGRDNPPVVIREPSLMFFPDDPESTAQRYCGRRALAEYIEAGMEGRFFQSVKSILPDPGFTHTTINGKNFSAEDLVAVMLRFLREQAELHTGVPITRAVVGRPARFSEDEVKEQTATQRLERAAGQAGFESIQLELEPVAGAHAYAASGDQRNHLDRRGSAHRLRDGQLVFVADHGGGTSDFTLFRLGHTADGFFTAREILGTHGIRAGGDDFDGAIMWNRIVDQFGHGSQYESFGKYLPVPVHIFHIISRWDQIHFLKTLKYREELQYYLRSSDNPLAIRRLIKLVEDNLGYFIFQAIEAGKIGLSNDDCAQVAFESGRLKIHEELTRHEFEGYIDQYIARITNAVELTLSKAGVDHVDGDSIGAVFMTGGSSRVPAVRRVLERRFGKRNIVDDVDQFQSVSRGLALIAREVGLSAA